MLDKSENVPHTIFSVAAISNDIVFYNLLFLLSYYFSSSSGSRLVLESACVLWPGGVLSINITRDLLYPIQTLYSEQ